MTVLTRITLCTTILCLCAFLPESSPAVAQTPVDLFTALPPSDAVITIDVKRVVHEAIPRLLTNEQALLTQVNTALADLKALTGLDPRAVQRMVVGLRYTKPVAGTSQPYFRALGIAQSSDAGQLPSLMRQMGPGKYREQQYGGKTLYIARPDETQRKIAESTAAPITGGAELAVAALDTNTIVFGYVAEVRLSIDVSAGKEARVSAELVAAATRNPKVLLSAASLLPPSLMSSVVSGQQLGSSELSQILSSCKQFYASVELMPTGFAVAVTVTAASPEQAKTLGDVLAAIKTLASVAPVKNTRDKLGRDMLKVLAITVSGTEVQVRDELTQATVQLLAKQIAADVYFGRGLAYMDKGDPDAAITEYDKAIALDPDRASTYINRGKARSEKGTLEAAIGDYDKAIALDPDIALAYNNRGFARLKKRDFDGAIVDLDKAIALDPGFAVAYNNRGLALAEKGNLDEAMADYDKSIALDTKNALAYSNRGLARSQKGDLDGAIADLDKAIAINSKSADAYNSRGLARFQKGELDAAMADYDKAIALDPNAAIAYNNRGFALAEKGNLDEAMADFNKAIAINPSLAEAYNGRGLARFQKGDFDQAIADFDKAIATNPNFAEAYGYRALSRLALSRDAEAAQDLKKCFELDGALQPAFEDLANEVKKTRRAKAQYH